MAGSYKKYRILAYLFGEDGKDAKKCVCICAYCLFSVLIYGDMMDQMRYCELMLLLSTTLRMVSANISATESCFTLAQRCE